MPQPTSAWLMSAVLAPALFGALTLWMPRRHVLGRVWIAAAGPALSFLSVLIHVAGHGIAGPNRPVATDPIGWIDRLNMNFAFLADGLGVFFALLVSGVGFLIVLYARAYFGRDEKSLFRFYPTLGLFATAMMGIVLSDYMLVTILFWELTSISSFLLIGWDREDPAAVKKAMQAFFTTGLGGMALLGGVLLFTAETGVWTWSEFLAWDVRITPAVQWAFAMVFLGAATKSAQWPWHYWLPGAMAAPTPVSAYLHSATMVKAGVYLVARVHPVFNELPVWPWLILIPGSITMLLGAALAINQHDLKRIFAYTTVSQLGLLMCAYGLSAFRFDAHGHELPAIDWDVTQIANHAFYKAPLFIVAGAIGHAAGTRQLPHLFGFVKKNAAMTIVMLLAAYALAAGPGTISFPAKEAFFYGIVHAAELHPVLWILAAMAVLTAVCNVAIFTRLLTTLLGLPAGLREPHLAHDDDHHEHAHDTAFWSAMLWVPAAIIVAWQYVGGLVPPVWNAVFGPLELNVNYFEAMPWPWQVHAGLPLYMSIAGFVGGVALGLAPWTRGTIIDIHDRVYPAMYWLAVTGGGKAFGLVQDGHYRHYLLVVLGALVIGFSGAVAIDPGMLDLPAVNPFEFMPGVMLGVIICATALVLPIVKARVVRVLVLGACGFSVVGMYLIYQAPDLALTQVTFEIISVILFVFVLRLLPGPDRKARPNRFMRAAVGVVVGVAFGWITLIAAETPSNRVLGPFFAEHSYTGTEATGGRGGGGFNIVNVILVDFRGFDTLGEISVLSIAALGVWSLLPGRGGQSRQRKAARA